MTPKISQRDIVHANQLIEKLRRYEEAHAKFKSGNGLHVRDAYFFIPSRYQREDEAEKGEQQYLQSALNDIGVDREMMSIIILARFALEAEKRVAETREALDKLGVEVE